jgi:dolichol kinase
MSYGRRLAHLSGTLVPVAYLADVLSWAGTQYLLAAGAVVAVVLELIRLQVGLDWAIYDRLTREYEQDNPAGYALAVVAAAAVGWTFVPGIAVPAILLLTVADPIAGIIASADSADTRKSWRVMVATFGVSLAIATPFLPLRAAVPVGLVVVAADAFKPRIFDFVVDDNVSIPVGAAVTGWLVLEVVPPLA